jgi:hypothetical protein
MQRAIDLFSTLAPVTFNTALTPIEDCNRIEEAIDFDLQPCTREEAAKLLTELLYAYPAVAAMKRSQLEAADFKIYSMKLLEALVRFPYVIGKLIVDGGIGVPAKVPYKPQPSDIAKFGNAERDKRINVKTMVQRHRAEALRREQESKDDTKYAELGDPEERKARIAAALANFKNNLPADPWAPKPAAPQVDYELLMASHDEGIQKYASKGR